MEVLKNNINQKNNNFIGSMIKELRKARNITLEALSNRCGLSKTYISQIENNKQTNPSISTLKKISDGIGVPIMAILDENYQEKTAPDKQPEEIADHSLIEEEIFIIRKNTRKVMRYPNSDWTIELLSPDLNRKIELIMTIAKPGQNSGESTLIHKGEEVGVVLEGKLKFTVGSREFILEEGDSIYFNSSLPHMWEVIGNKLSKTIWAITPPSF